MAAALALLVGTELVGCGGAPWPEHTTARFVLECAHAEAACEGCHPAGQPLGPVEGACAACHLVDRPDTHDPATTATCEPCHQGSCDWSSSTSPHPPGWAEPEQHGLAVNLHDPVQGVCQECHGADLAGGSAVGCDDCHADQGHADWRTDCTFCHGRAAGAFGAPPDDVDGETDPTRISFRAHVAHVTAGPEVRTLPCADCHVPPTDVLTPGHLFDDTPGVAEVDFSASPAPETVWGGVACTNSWCHGKGQRPDGAVVDGGVSLDCDGCHRTTSGFEGMSGDHALHQAAGMACADCHADVIDAFGTIVVGPRHVNGAVDVAFVEPGMSRAADGTCDGGCHGFTHAGTAWGGPASAAAREGR